MRKGLAVTAAVLVLVVALAALGVAQQMPQGTGGVMGPGMGHGQVGPQGMGSGGMGGQQGGRMTDMMQMMQQMMGMMQQMMQMAPMSPEQRQAMAAQCRQIMGQPDPTPGPPRTR